MVSGQGVNDEGIKMEGDNSLALATIAAVFLGPIAAVLITRLIDNYRLRSDRRMDVFRTLMRTRKMKLTPEHVGALNVVEIEFHGERKVIDAWRNYFEHLAKKVPADKVEEDAFHRERDGLLAKLLHAIAKVLNFKIEQLEIFEGGYVPQGWWQDEVQLRALRHYMLQIFMGNRGLPITQFTSAPSGSPFPPPPSVQ